MDKHVYNGHKKGEYSLLLLFPFILYKMASEIKEVMQVSTFYNMVR